MTHKTLRFLPLFILALTTTLSITSAHAAPKTTVTPVVTPVVAPTQDDANAAKDDKAKPAPTPKPKPKPGPRDDGDGD